ncbi:hypothetical protein VM1G_09111 [Cytospora mali]|uniref:Rhodopsin domain-containing protein n=1 Tax=Cytospora mali TaxID=578113 RepID=A0A194WB30_CYTMA|nr:hypothetical protein VM1G_09111 [Valsa mali]
MDSFMMRSGYAELAKTVHSTFGSLTTVFLFTRLWARSTQYKGLWWDDYLLIAAWAFQLCGNGLSAASPAHGFNILNGTTHGWTLTFSALTTFYIATALAKSAFAATLLRISGGKTKTLLWFLVLLVWACSITLAVVTWLDICEQRIDYSLSSRCLPLGSVIWLHLGYCIFTVCTDTVLAYLPWRIINTIYIPKREKYGVALSLSLVGLSGILCLVRAVIGGYTQELASRENKVDWTYGAVTIYCIQQAEVAVFIIAQTIPVLRVLLNREPKSSQGDPVGSIAGFPLDSGADEGKSLAVETGREASIELVQLPSGKIVAADSEEGKEFKASAEEENAGQARVVDSPGTPEQAVGGVANDDEVHRIWADMGLSRRAWSQSP